MVNYAYLPMLVVILTVSVFCCLATNATDSCDLNEDTCFANADKTDWTFNYVTSKQEYIERISQGKSGITNPYIEKEGLARRDGVKVGHVESVKLGDGKTVDVITRAMRPLLFEIPDFLSAEECDHIIKRAQDPNEGGMSVSVAKGGLTEVDTFQRTGKKGKALGVFGEFTSWDKNKDNRVNIEEMTVFIHAHKSIILLEQDLKEMFAKLEMELYLRDDVIDEGEFEYLDTLGLEEYVDILAREHPRFQVRNSNQAWLLMDHWVDKIVHSIRERVVTITGLPREIIYGGESLQVAHYEPLGHYHAHMDTETHKFHRIPCCHQQFPDNIEQIDFSAEKCRMCRYITFMTYLNDVDEGGETAFPVADGVAMDEIEMADVLRGNSSTDKFNLSHGCKRANLVIQPKKGKSVMWYNHLVNETDGWLGEMDLSSLHGGCDVIKGEKWIANMWLPAPYGFLKRVPSGYLNWKGLYDAVKQGSI